LGLTAKGIRLPLTWFSNEYHDQLEAAMQRAGVL
jgi:4-hydroxy-tetrahydrodipicolinate synthase